MKLKIKIINDEKFVRNNFENLVNTYGGTTIVIANGEVFTGTEASRKALKKYPKVHPFILPLPRPEFFNHHFILCVA